jgi:TRAP-type C4-dicarboxylate transport system permease small subunit
MKIILKLKMILEKILKSALVVFLLSMIVLALMQVILRKVFNTAVPDADKVITMLIYYIAIFGATVATLQDKHINIEIITNFVNDKWKKILLVLANAFSIFIMILLLSAVREYLLSQSESLEFFLADIPTYYVEGAIYPCFILMVLAFLTNMLEAIFSIKKVEA